MLKLTFLDIDMFLVYKCVSKRYVYYVENCALHKEITSKYVSYESQTLVFAVGRSTTSLGSCQKCRHTSQCVSWVTSGTWASTGSSYPMTSETSSPVWTGGQFKMNTQNKGLTDHLSPTPCFKLGPVKHLIFFY